MRAAVVLLSGGLDSTTALACAVRDGFRAYTLTVRYGQRHGLEVDRAAEIARSLGAAEHHVVDLDLTFLAGSALTDRRVDVPKGRAMDTMASAIPRTYVPGRNTVFLALAMAWAESLGARDLFVGVNSVDYSGYPDCRPEFLAAFERTANLGTRTAPGRDLELTKTIEQITWRGDKVVVIVADRTVAEAFDETGKRRTVEQRVYTEEHWERQTDGQWKKILIKPAQTGKETK